MKYKGDLKKIHKPVTDMAESLSMQHSLSTSKLSSDVRHHHPFNPLTFQPRKLLGVSSVSVHPLWFTELCLKSVFPSPLHHTTVTIHMLQIFSCIYALSSIIQTSIIPWPHLVVILTHPSHPSITSTLSLFVSASFFPPLYSFINDH